MDPVTDRRPHLRGAPGGSPVRSAIWAMGLGVLLTLVGLFVPELGIASSTSPSLVATITASRGAVAVEVDDAGHPVAPVEVTYRITIENTGDAPVHGVVARVELGDGLVPRPGSRTELDVGDLAARSSRRSTLTTTVDPATLSGSQLSPVVVVETADGGGYASPPAVTTVSVLGPATVLTR